MSCFLCEHQYGHQIGIAIGSHQQGKTPNSVLVLKVGFPWRKLLVEARLEFSWVEEFRTNSVAVENPPFKGINSLKGVNGTRSMIFLPTHPQS